MREKSLKLEGQKYVDILTDCGFKALFGDEKNTEIVKFIINTLLPQQKQIKDIKLLPTEQPGSSVGISKKYHYDFLCEDEKGRKFIVEMQQYSDSSWFERCVSYVCRAYDRQHKIGATYKVPPVYLIGIMGVEINHANKEAWRECFVSEYTLMERRTYDLLGETIFIIFAELANFNKGAEECETDLDKVLYLLKNLGTMQEEPKGFEHQMYADFLQACEIAGFDDAKLSKYTAEMKDEWAMKSMLDTAREEGEAEGLAKGEARGKADGLVEGKARGKAEQQRDIALKLLKMGLPLQQISEATGLSVEELKKL